MKITLTIIASHVLAKVEGLTAILGDHNPGVPFDTLWASAGDAGKLSIYMKEAITDLEDALRKKLIASSGKFDVLRWVDDYQLTLNLSDYWDEAMRGLMENKLQDYLAHGIVGMWLQDIPADLKVPDYADMAAQELGSLIKLSDEKRIPFTGSDRKADDEAVKIKHTTVDFGAGALLGY